MKLIKKADNWYNLYDGDIGIGSTNVDLQGYRLSLNNCIDIERGYDLDELARQSRDKVSMLFKDGLHEKSHTVGFRAGWQNAINIKGDRKYSINEVVELCKILLSNPIEKSGRTYQELVDSYTKSLQQTEWDVEVEMEKVKDEIKIVGAIKGVKGSGSKITTYKSVPKLDADGCLILKRI